VGVLDDVSTWSADLSAVVKPFVVMTAFDMKGLDDATLVAFTGRLLADDCRYACCWGHGCGRLEYAFDRVIVDQGLDRADEPVMTTAHEDESLDEALWFATQVAWVPGLQDHSQHVLVLAAPEYVDHVTMRLANIDKLIADVVPEDE
jgi:hypothetical protein